MKYASQSFDRIQCQRLFFRNGDNRVTELSTYINMESAKHIVAQHPNITRVSIEESSTNIPGIINTKQVNNAKQVCITYTSEEKKMFGVIVSIGGVLFDYAQHYSTFVMPDGEFESKFYLFVPQETNVESIETSIEL